MKEHDLNGEIIGNIGKTAAMDTPTVTVPMTCFAEHADITDGGDSHTMYMKTINKNECTCGRNCIPLATKSIESTMTKLGQAHLQLAHDVPVKSWASWLAR